MVLLAEVLDVVAGSLGFCDDTVNDGVGVRTVAEYADGGVDDEVEDEEDGFDSKETKLLDDPDASWISESKRLIMWLLYLSPGY